MRESIAADLPFELSELSPADARAFLVEHDQPFKVEIVDDLLAAAERDGAPAPPTTFYRQGPFIDLCRGPHVASTGKIGPFKLLGTAGAYWRGDEKRPMLQRVYGTAWATQEQLDQFLWRREEAKKRDHRRLGAQLDLFSFHDVSPGSAFWHPKGQLIWRTLESAMRELQRRRGYQEVSTPIVVSERLWQQSGHWDLYRDNMFLIESEGQTFSLKPMNCPESTFIYRSHLRSYRDLPLRFSEFGRLHRNERSGTLSGLTRVRQFIQDDAHLYVRPDQLTDEIEALLGEVREAYGWFGLEPRFAFATKPDKALGDPALWERAEQLIREAFAAADITYTLKPKDGTFYAPKIDIYIDDALGREWQMATIQVDLVMLPERFDLTYIDETGQPQRPIAIHRAIYGSLERFIGILLEHFAGALPLWIAPVQAVVIPIADRHIEAAEELADVLRARDLRVEVDRSDNRMQNKIRLAQEQKVPYMLVLGDREVEARTVAPRARNAARGEQQEAVAWETSPIGSPKSRGRDQSGDRPGPDADSAAGSAPPGAGVNRSVTPPSAVAPLRWCRGARASRAAAAGTGRARNKPATFQASIRPIASVNSTGFIDAEPASRNDMFMRAPKKAAIPVKTPTRRPIPIASSPKVMTARTRRRRCCRSGAAGSCGTSRT